MQHRKPRNPIVPALARRNGAGAHQKSGKAKRLAAARELARRLKEDAGIVQHARNAC